MTDRQNDLPNDFFEEDEPVEDIVAAFEAGPHGITERPRPIRVAASGQIQASATYLVFCAPLAADTAAYQQA